MPLSKLGLVKVDLLTNKAYGFVARGQTRRISPVVLAVIHITGNPKNQSANAAQNERDYANRDNSQGPSAHFYINRNGGGVKALDFVKYAAWSNGDLIKPNTKNAGVMEIVKLHDHGFNANECVGVEIENVGYSKPAGQLTTEQIRRCGRIVARASIAFNLPINRNTVLAHADINSVDRQNCPALPKDREKVLEQIINIAVSRKRAILAAKKKK